ncbi:17,18-epoxy-17-hydroxycur-19-ene N-malonyltransferase-like [Bidens hawaiensis]|uniref:17,18-epoxy-17-hydroxycur-19-ene N-malonyltransferase-like n=1 Tax=Bidens hawaiensis TaxID=980011 RepID=UPI00404B86E4
MMIIISHELVKPSSPCPSHLKTYNLSGLDLRSIHEYMPLILYYPNNETCSLTPDDKVKVMKKSLSEVLTRYYPFAGSLHTPTSTYIDCNDEGAVFVEAKHDSQMNMLQHISEDNDTVGHLFVDGMYWPNSPYTERLLGIQVNHFACGGITVAISLQHKVGDGCTLGSFVSHWASVAHYGSTDHKEVLSLDPYFVQSPATTNFIPLEISDLLPKRPNAVTRKFMFPNTKLSDLKNKVVTEGGSTLSINNPTRVEVLTSLLYKTVAVATTPRASSFKPYFLLSAANIRNKFVPELPQTTVGNYNTGMLVTSRHESETSLSVLVSKIRKEKIKLERLQNVQLVQHREHSMLLSFGNEDAENVVNRSFLTSSLCGFPYYKVDFGWGNPAVSSMTLRHANRAGCYLIDTPNGDGIEAWVTLDTQDMERFQNDKELLSFCQN